MGDKQLTFEHLTMDVELPKSKNPFKRCMNKKDVEMAETNGAPEGYKRILKEMSATFEPGTITAIMGSSGAGKTSLLNVLAGRAQGKIGGSITINGSPISELKSSFKKVLLLLFTIKEPSLCDAG